MPDIELDVPAEAEYVSLVRMVVSSLLSDRWAVDDEQLDDLALAVSEACALAIGTADNRTTIRCREETDAVLITVSPTAKRGATDVVDPLELIQALVDEVDVAADGITMRVRCAPAS
jgi:anti-sigma regulatory factor (Ser/Thr protein kinase)